MRRSVDDVLIAELRLRFRCTVLEAHIYWPPRAVAPGAAPLAVVLADDSTSYGADFADLLGRGLSTGAGVVAMRVLTSDQTMSLAALAWAADHAHELGGRADRIIVAGGGISGGRAARLALTARDNRWPLLHRQVLVHPRFTNACPLPSHVAGVVPATIVCSGIGPLDDGTRYAAQLKRSGVEVRELRQPYSGSCNQDEERQMVHVLARSLRADLACDGSTQDLKGLIA